MPDYWPDRTEIVHLAQGLSALCWCAVAWSFRQGVILTLLGRGNAANVFGALWAFVGLTQAAFSLRWFIWPGAVPIMSEAQTSLWLALYFASAVEALALVVAGRAWRKINP